MKLKMFSIYDAVADVYSTPFFMHNDELALRAFRELANSDDNEIGKYPGDKTLVRVGEFDDQSCVVEAFFEELAVAATLVEAKK